MKTFTQVLLAALMAVSLSNFDLNAADTAIEVAPTTGPRRSTRRRKAKAATKGPRRSTRRRKAKAATKKRTRDDRDANEATHGHDSDGGDGDATAAALALAKAQKAAKSTHRDKRRETEQLQALGNDEDGDTGYAAAMAFTAAAQQEGVGGAFQGAGGPSRQADTASAAQPTAKQNAWFLFRAAQLARRTYSQWGLSEEQIAAKKRADAQKQLLTAVASENLAGVQAALAAGANPTERNSEGTTAFSMATVGSKIHQELITVGNKQLLADIQKGDSPALEDAATLLEHGANPYALTESRRTILEESQFLRRAEFTSLLTQTLRQRYQAELEAIHDTEKDLFKRETDKALNASTQRTKKAAKEHADTASREMDEALAAFEEEQRKAHAAEADRLHNIMIALIKEHKAATTKLETTRLSKETKALLIQKEAQIAEKIKQLNTRYPGLY